MKYLHLITHDANDFGHHDPGARRKAAKDEQLLQAMSVAELIRLGAGWITDGPLSREEIANTYHGHRSETITDEQAAEWTKNAGPLED